ncbi:MAG: hypothetical protein LBH22_04420, partial [Bacteroidales bacterium]|nr:hypothetical protein [Bacteroidales bacterium]
AARGRTVPPTKNCGAVQLHTELHNMVILLYPVLRALHGVIHIKVLTDFAICLIITIIHKILCICTIST